MKSVEKLKNLTEELPQVPHLRELYHKDTDGVREYNEIDGTIVGENLMYEKEVAVQNVFIKSNTAFPLHVHEKEIEYLVIYNGQFSITIEDQELILNKGDFIKIEKGKKHCTKAITDTNLLAIAIPRIDGFPKS